MYFLSGGFENYPKLNHKGQCPDRSMGRGETAEIKWDGENAIPWYFNPIL